LTKRHLPTTSGFVQSVREEGARLRARFKHALDAFDATKETCRGHADRTISFAVAFAMSDALDFESSLITPVQARIVRASMRAEATTPHS
jgi:hypothetical protein